MQTARPEMYVSMRAAATKFAFRQRVAPILLRRDYCLEGVRRILDEVRLD